MLVFKRPHKNRVKLRQWFLVLGVWRLQVVASVFEFQYIGGSMSSGVGDRILAAIDVAISKKVPFICLSRVVVLECKRVHSLMQWPDYHLH